jgi:hypothetical protein
MNAIALKLDYANGWQWLAELENACVENGQTGRALQRKAGNDFVRENADTNHEVTSDTSQQCEESDMLSNEKNARNVRESDPRKIPADEIGQDELTECWSEALRRATLSVRSPAKFLAQVANSNVRTAENWLAGKSTPGLLHSMRLSKLPEVQIEMCRLMALQSEGDPKAWAMFLEFQRAVLRGGVA